MARRIQSREMVAEAVNMDIADVSDYRYHYGHTSIPVFAIGETYYCATKIDGKPATYRGEEGRWDWKKGNYPHIESKGWCVWESN